ncbi:hypothetical protein CKF54_05245 [Psittacicella hinzii]|uniref:Uncharacterized protein n=1 Tax=Psittacicella hinzii TaxID=2028575 RepID=A0A3A1Y1Y1_9GAMM|nr:hypothetical protein [Psittacicella hinzii]RIY32243.1 hypothetical protein CKF54_05245 [Psittacicella hinzii]
MAEIETKPRRRKRRKSNLPDPIKLANNYIEVLIAKLAIKKKRRIKILSLYPQIDERTENTFAAEKVDGLLGKQLDTWYDSADLIVKSEGAVKSIYYERIKQLKVFTYNLNTKVNYLTHDPKSPLRSFYERENIKNAEKVAGFTNSVTNKKI